jgi:hypothetical protein
MIFFIKNVIGYSHRLGINRPTKSGKEKSPSDGHCQCQKEIDDQLLACHQFLTESHIESLVNQRATFLNMNNIIDIFIFWNVWLLSLLFYSVSVNANSMVLPQSISGVSAINPLVVTASMEDREGCYSFILSSQKPHETLSWNISSLRLSHNNMDVIVFVTGD